MSLNHDLLDRCCQPAEIAGPAVGSVHNRLLTPFVIADQSGFVALNALIRRGAAQARRRDFATVPVLGAPFHGAGAVTG